MMAIKHCPYSAEEVAYLRANYGKLSHAEMARNLNRGMRGIIAKITDLRLVRHWHKHEDDFLRENRSKGWEWCAKQLGRTAVSVYNRVRRLGIQQKFLNKNDLKQLRLLHAQGLHVYELAEKLGVSTECIRTWLRKFGLPTPKRDEKRRMEVQRQNYLKKYGVESSAQARKVRERTARKAAFAVQIDSLSKELEKACQASSL